MEITTLNLTDIRTNPLNIYQEQTIKELADSILQWGQLENATVYKDEQADGKKYTLIGGHRRFMAISYLAERNLYPSKIHVNIVSKPMADTEEKMMIVADNHQRVKDKQTKLREIQYANDYWNYLVSINQKPRLEHGQKKRDWIAKKTGYGARVVQDILTEIRNANTTENPTSSSNNRTSASPKDRAIKQLKQARGNLSKWYDLESNQVEFEKILGYIRTLDELLERIG